jgi:hypothetical protein
VYYFVSSILPGSGRVDLDICGSRPTRIEIGPLPPIGTGRLPPNEIGSEERPAMAEFGCTSSPICERRIKSFDTIGTVDPQSHDLVV